MARYKKRTKKETGNKMKSGDCYETNGRWMIGKDGYKLVHGVVINQKDGKPMGHCWIERDGVVYDYSNNDEIIFPKDFYYDLAQIPVKGYKLYKYNWEKMGIMILKHEHWGPWESKPPR